jgi:nitrogen fixation NifU-like protein
MQYFLHPKNVGEIKDADGIGKVGNMTCGDIMHVYIKIGKKGKEEIIKDIKFRTLGCTAAIATSAVVTELAKGKTLSKAIKITNSDVIKKLGGLPPIKHHCSLLAEEALSEAIYNFLKKNNKSIPKELKKKHKRALESEEEFAHKFHKH